MQTTLGQRGCVISHSHSLCSATTCGEKMSMEMWQLQKQPENGFPMLPTIFQALESSSPLIVVA